MQFVKHEDVFAAGIKSEMARSRPWLHLHPGRFTWQQLSVSSVEAENHNLVCSQIARVGEPVRGIKHDTMGMRAFLTLPVYARAPALLHIRSLAQTAVALNREDRHVASGVIRYQNKLASSIHIYITGVGARRCLLVQQPQFASSLIDSKRAHGSALCTRKISNFVDRVQITPAGCESEKRRVNYAPGGADML